MKKTITIKNAADILKQLEDLLIQFDLDLNRYQTDVYLYIKEDGSAYLQTFLNVGGNSWIQDDHITIYSDKEHFDSEYDSFDSISTYADLLGITPDELTETVRHWMYEEDGEDFEIYLSDIQLYFQNHSDLDSLVINAYHDLINDLESEGVYREKACMILNEFDSDVRSGMCAACEDYTFDI